MDATTLTSGIAIGFTVAMAVGPISLLTIRRTLAHGRAYGLASGVGVALADASYGGIGGVVARPDDARERSADAGDPEGSRLDHPGVGHPDRRLRRRRDRRGNRRAELNLTSSPDYDPPGGAAVADFGIQGTPGGSGEIPGWIDRIRDILEPLPPVFTTFWTGDHLL